MYTITRICGNIGLSCNLKLHFHLLEIISLTYDHQIPGTLYKIAPPVMTEWTPHSVYNALYHVYLRKCRSFLRIAYKFNFPLS